MFASSVRASASRSRASMRSAGSAISSMRRATTNPGIRLRPADHGAHAREPALADELATRARDGVGDALEERRRAVLLEQRAVLVRRSHENVDAGARGAAGLEERLNRAWSEQRVHGDRVA